MVMAGKAHRLHTKETKDISLWNMPYRDEGAPIEGSGTVDDMVVKGTKCGVYERQGIKRSSTDAFAGS